MFLLLRSKNEKTRFTPRCCIDFHCKLLIITRKFIVGRNNGSCFHFDPLFSTRPRFSTSQDPGSWAACGFKKPLTTLCFQIISPVRVLQIWVCFSVGGGGAGGGGGGEGFLLPRLLVDYIAFSATRKQTIRIFRHQSYCPVYRYIPGQLLEHTLPYTFFHTCAMRCSVRVIVKQVTYK